MIVGIDFYGTIDKSPKTFRKLSEALLAQGHTVYIISAVKNVSKLEEEVKKSKVPYTHLEIILFKDYLDVPQLKLEACKRLGVKMMFDDREDTCELLSSKRILALRTI